MKALLVGTILSIIAVWLLANALSADPLAMGLGIIFGAASAIPAALLVLATGRRSNACTPRTPTPRTTPPPPPVIMVQDRPALNRPRPAALPQRPVAAYLEDKGSRI